MRFKLLFSQLLLLLTVLISCAPTFYREQEGTASPSHLRSAVESRNNSGEGPAAPSSAPETDGSSACLGCHNYGENHHPVDFVLTDASNFPFPLYNHLVRCLTCHTEDHMGSPFMLRGGPYTNRREVCFQCHYEEEYSYIYPHIMLDDKNKVIELNGRPVCLVCHSRMPDPRVDRTRDVTFRADVAFLCWRCHSLMKQAVLNQHVLLKPPLEMVRYMEQNEKKLDVTIPLVPRERITCSTCHNPHQKGVIIYVPSAKGADEPDRLRIEAPALCVVCHIT